MRDATLNDRFGQAGGKFRAEPSMTTFMSGNAPEALSA
jgi:hypothetical protein